MKSLVLVATAFLVGCGEPTPKPVDMRGASDPVEPAMTIDLAPDTARICVACNALINPCAALGLVCNPTLHCCAITEH